VLALSAGTALAADVAFEAETMSYGSFAQTISASSGSGGQALRFNSSGTANKQVSTSDAGQDIVVLARTTADAGAEPEMRVLLDGAEVGSFTSIPSGTFTELSASVAVPAGAHEIAVEGTVTSAKRLVVDLIRIPSASTPPPGQSECEGLQAAINNTPAGDTLDLPDNCIYREQVDIPRSMTLIGGPGVEIRGSEVWSAEAWNGSTSVRTVPAFYQEDASCEKGSPPRCAWQEQVFVDGVELEQVASSVAPAPGQFRVDSERHVVLGESPSGHTVEVTVRKHWITGTARADNVTIRNLDMRHAAADWRCGGLQSREPSTRSGPSFDSCRNGANSSDGEAWKLYDSEISYAHGAGVSLRGDDSLLQGNFIHHNGELGIHNPGDGSSVRGNEVAHNNTQGFCIRPSTDYCQVFPSDGDTNFDPDPLTESGGMKISGGKDNILVDSNEFHHNYGNAMWCDVGCHDMTITNNVAHHNGRRGIFFEISYRAEISGNTLYENGWATPGGMNGPGLEVGTSDGANVHHNTLAWNAYGILAKCSSGRDNASCEGNFIHDNTVLQEEPGLALGWTGQSQFFTSSANNKGSNNHFYYGHTEDSRYRFQWNTKHSKLSSFNSTPGEQNGRYLTEGEKAALGVPEAPEW